MRELHLNTCIGMGDAILLSSALCAVKDKFDKIYISPNWDLIQAFRCNNQKYKQFYSSFIPLIYDDPVFEIIDTVIHQPVANIEHLIGMGIHPGFRKFPKLHEGIDSGISGDFVVLSTKVRPVNRVDFEQIKPRFIERLKDLSRKYQIVLMGERVLEYNQEYEIFRNCVYSIYNDIIGNVDVLDITVPNLGIQEPDLDNIRKDCAIMAASKAVISIGYAGNVSLAVSVANKFVGYSKQYYEPVQKEYVKHPHLCLTTNIEEFLARIAEI